jgi:hypothetical protein
LADLIEAAIEGEEIFIVTQDQHIIQLVLVASVLDLAAQKVR